MAERKRVSKGENNSLRDCENQQAGGVQAKTGQRRRKEVNHRTHYFLLLPWSRCGEGLGPDDPPADLARKPDREGQGLRAAGG
jgi:hypothetical protein